MELNEPTLRFLAFASIFAACAGAEAVFPRRRRERSRLDRWVPHVLVAGVNQLLARVLLPASAISVAAFAEANHYGVLNLLKMPTVAEWIVGLLLLDLAIYGQHVMFHYVPLFWRFHMMHHTDTDFDVTTGIRFHPISILMSACIKLGVVLLLGPPVMMVIVFEVLLNATSMFNHSNLGIPANIDRWLRWFVVTPDMHRVHHSVHVRETNSNYGFNFPWWDRIFRTYKVQPQDGHDGMQIGLEEHRAADELKLGRLLTLPFRTASRTR